ncbi:MAG: ACT domain-containing protein, partial [Candidatus Omnitrophica bacterium]|nr:ACT domain-containing protein [Candidatus Omnitrophota bacterium]
HLIMGTLFSNKEPRIVMVDKFYVEAIPAGSILFVKNNDVPGIVGKVGTILGEAKVNIAGIHLGRDEQRKLAVSILNLDSDVPKETIEKLKKVQDILDVKQIKLT